MGISFVEAITNLESLQKDYQDFHDDVWQDPESYGVIAESLRIGIDTMRKYQQMQADYENRLKADMVDMLEELDFRLSNYQDTDLIRQDIQEKITELKENR